MATVPFCCGKPCAQARRGHPVWRRPSRLAQNTKCIRRGGFNIRPRAFAPPQGPAGWGIPPYGRPDGRGHFGWPKTKKLFVGAGFIPPAGVRAAAGSGGMGHPALRPPGRPRPFRLAQNKKIIRRGGIYPARRRSRRRGVPGTMRASSPTEVCNDAKVVFSRLAAAFSVGCRGGFHIRPRNPALPHFPGWYPCFPRSVGRAFTPAAPWQFQKRNPAPPRGLRDDASIVPYRGLL